MADNEVSVSLTAKIDGLTSGLTEAVNAMREAVSAISEDTHKLESEGKEANETLKEILGVEKFLAFVEGVKAAFEGVHEAFELLKEGYEGTIAKAEEFGLSNAKVSALMHISEADAAGLQAALRGVGVETSSYESIALRLQQRLQTGTGINKELADSLKGANGEALSGTPLIERLKDVMGGYTEEAQNAIVVQLGLGRRASDLYDIFRVTSESIEHQKDLYRAMGVDIDSTAQASQRLEEVENDLRTEVEALGIKIGQELLPYAEEALTWMGENGTAFVKELAEAIADLARTVVQVAQTFVHGLSEMAGSLGRLKHPQGVMDWLNALDEVTGNGGPIDKTTSQTDTLSGAMDTATSAVDHLSGAFGGLFDAMGKHAPTKEDIFGVGEKSLLDIGEGAAPETNPVAAAIAKAKNPYALGTGTKKAPTPTKGGGGANPADQEDQEAISAATKRVQAEISLEEGKNAHLLAMGKETADEFVAQQRELEGEKYAVQLSALQQELQIPHRTAAEKNKVNDEIEQLASTHEAALVKIEQDGDARRATAAKKAIADAQQADDERLKAGTAAINDLAAMGQISAAQRYQEERALTLEIRGEEIARLDAELATLRQGTEQYDAVVKQRQKLEAQLTTELHAENVKRRADIEAQIKPAFSVISSSAFTAFNDAALHGKSFAETMRGLFTNIVDGFVQMAEQMAEKWALTQLVNQAVAQSAGATEAATEATQAATGASAAQAARAVADVAQVQSLAAVAGAAAFAANIGIPVVGPAVATAAMAAAIAQVEGLVPLASAAGGMMVDHDQLAFVHKQEMVLPAAFSQGLQRMISTWQGGGGAPSVNLNYAPTINGAGADMAALLERHKSEIFAMLRQGARDGAFDRRI